MSRFAVLLAAPLLLLVADCSVLSPGERPAELTGTPVAAGQWDAVAGVPADDWFLPLNAGDEALAWGPRTIRSAALRIDGVTVVVNSERQQVFDPRCFTEHGIDPAAQRVLVVKSTAHFRNAFGPLAARIIDCDSPGSLTMDVTALPYRRIPRPLFPLDRGFDMQPALLYPARSPRAGLP